MLPVYRQLLDQGIKVLVYSGDVDAIVPGQHRASMIHDSHYQGTSSAAAGFMHEQLSVHEEGPFSLHQLVQWPAATQ